MSSGGGPPFCAWWTAASWPSASLFSASRCAARSFFCASRSATRTQHSKLRCVEMNLCSFIYVLLHRPSFECKPRNSCEPLKNLKLFLEFLRIRIGIAFFVFFFLPLRLLRLLFRCCLLCPLFLLALLEGQEHFPRNRCVAQRTRLKHRASHL